MSRSGKVKVKVKGKGKVVWNALTKRLIIQNKKELSTINIIPRRSLSPRVGLRSGLGLGSGVG